jgi:hypothetical protein
MPCVRALLFLPAGGARRDRTAHTPLPPILGLAKEKGECSAGEHVKDEPIGAHPDEENYPA